MRILLVAALVILVLLLIGWILLGIFIWLYWRLDGGHLLPVLWDDDGCIDFPWLPSDTHPDTINAWMHFISALCEMARNAHRVSAKEKEIANEKYEFRCFLLRLGMIGDEYKQVRKILLKNLSGSAAFKSPVAKGGEQA